MYKPKAPHRLDSETAADYGRAKGQRRCTVLVI